MEMFTVVRLGPKGPDSSEHMFCVAAAGNPELIRTSEGETQVLINGVGSSDPKWCRTSAEKFCAALNEQFQRYMNGEFHE